MEDFGAPSMSDFNCWFTHHKLNIKMKHTNKDTSIGTRKSYSDYCIAIVLLVAYISIEQPMIRKLFGQ